MFTWVPESKREGSPIRAYLSTNIECVMYDIHENPEVWEDYGIDTDKVHYPDWGRRIDFFYAEVSPHTYKSNATYIVEFYDNIIDRDTGECKLIATYEGEEISTWTAQKKVESIILRAMANDAEQEYTNSELFDKQYVVPEMKKRFAFVNGDDNAS